MGAYNREHSELHHDMNQESDLNVTLAPVICEVIFNLLVMKMSTDMHIQISGACSISFMIGMQLKFIVCFDVSTYGGTTHRSHRCRGCCGWQVLLVVLLDWIPRSCRPAGSAERGRAMCQTHKLRFV